MELFTKFVERIASPLEAVLNLSHNTILQPFFRHAAPTLRQ